MGQGLIEDIQLDTQSLHETTAIRCCVQHKSRTRGVREKVAGLLDQELFRKVRHHTGQPAKNLWQDLVQGILKQCLHLDLDPLRVGANQHR